MKDDQLADEVEKAVLDALNPKDFVGIDWAASEKMLEEAMREIFKGTVVTGRQLVTFKAQLALETANTWPYHQTTRFGQMMK